MEIIDLLYIPIIEQVFVLEILIDFGSSEIIINCKVSNINCCLTLMNSNTFASLINNFFPYRRIQEKIWSNGFIF